MLPAIHHPILAHPFAEAGMQHQVVDSKTGLSHTNWSAAFATPMTRWWARFPTILPNGSVVFELRGQIVIMDRQRRIGVLCMGESPAVILDAAPEAQWPTGN